MCQYNFDICFSNASSCFACMALPINKFLLYTYTIESKYTNKFKIFTAHLTSGYLYVNYAYLLMHVCNGATEKQQGKDFGIREQNSLIYIVHSYIHCA